MYQNMKFTDAFFITVFHNIKKIIPFICSIILLTNCQNENRQLNDALTLARQNRAELETVLEHYKNDSLKLKAAQYLIANMPGHFSYDNPRIEQYYNSVDSILELKRSLWDTRSLIENLSKQYTNIRLNAIYDIEIIKADFLICNIDSAFAQWQQGEWAQHLSFDEFCEYLLPYKTFELQPLDEWRTYLKGTADKNLDQLAYCDLYKNSSVRATQCINSNLREIMKPFLLQSDAFPIYRLKTKLKMPYGLCEDYVKTATAVLRSHGIPVAIDFTPQWPFRSQGHSWNVVLANNGMNIPFVGAGENPGDPHKPDEKMAKVYRHTYAINPDIQDLLKKEKFVPNTFVTPFFKDVTKEYMKTADILLNIDKTQNKYAYLCVFDNKEWVPIAFGKINKRKVTFKDMGKDIVYLPVHYPGKNPAPLGYPFLLTETGDVETFIPDTTRLQTLVLYRKYPVFSHVQEIAGRIIGGVFQASDNEHFIHAVTIHKIQEWGTRGREIVLPDSTGKYRYWRFYHPIEYSYCNIAEISFVEKDTHKIIKGDIIGTKDSYTHDGNNCREAAFDNDLLTFFDAPVPAGGWTGMDFGRPVNIEKIIYTPRGDGNSIAIGDLYELFYWNNNRWISLGKQTAGTVMLQYDNAPTNALFLLRNLTQGEEERIFTYKDGKQIFW